MKSFRLYLENQVNPKLAAQGFDHEVQSNLRKFLKSTKDFQILFLVYHLIVDAHYHQPEQIYDFILFLFPDSDRDRQQTMWGDRLRKFIKLALAQQTLPDKQAQAVTIALSQVLDVWVGGVELALGEFTALDHLPHRLYLCGGGASLQLLVERLHDSDWYTRLPFTRKPTIEHIHPDQVVGIVDQSGKVTDHTYVTAMGLLRVGLDTVQSTGVGEADTVKQKIDRILHV